MTGYESKRAMAQDKLIDDDDIQVYKRPWVDVQDEEIKRLWIQYRAALPRYLCFAKALLAKTKKENT